MEKVKVTEKMLSQLPAGAWLYTSTGAAMGTLEWFCVKRIQGATESREYVGGIDDGKTPRGGPGSGGATKRHFEACRKLFSAANEGRLDVFVSSAVAAKLGQAAPEICSFCGGTGGNEKNGYDVKCSYCRGTGHQNGLPSLDLTEKSVGPPSPSAANVPAHGKWGN